MSIEDCEMQNKMLMNTENCEMQNKMAMSIENCEMQNKMVMNIENCEMQIHDFTSKLEQIDNFNLESKHVRIDNYNSKCKLEQIDNHNSTCKLVQIVKELFEALTHGERSIKFMGIIVDREYIFQKQTARQIAVLLRVIEALLQQTESQTTCTKRDIYYMNTRLFGNQRVVNSALMRIQRHLNVPLHHLNVRSSGKGLVFGHLRIVQSLPNSMIDCLESGKEILIPSTECISSVQLTGKAMETVVIVVEKDALFQHLVQSFWQLQSHLKCNIILITGKGFPCEATCNLLEHLQNQAFVKDIVGIFDLDPYGLCIYKTYRFGSKKTSRNLRIRYLGITPGQIQQYANFCSDKPLSAAYCQLTLHDFKMLTALMKCSQLMCEERSRECIEFLKQFEQKYELEAIYEHEIGNMIKLICEELNVARSDERFVSIL